MQGQLRRAVRLGALLLLPGQVLLAHGIVPVHHGREGRRCLLGRHDSAAEEEEREREEKEEVSGTWHKGRRLRQNAAPLGV